MAVVHATNLVLVKNRLQKRMREHGAGRRLFNDPCTVAQTNKTTNGTGPIVLRCLADRIVWGLASNLEAHLTYMRVGQTTLAGSPTGAPNGGTNTGGTNGKQQETTGDNFSGVTNWSTGETL